VAIPRRHTRTSRRILTHLAIAQAEAGVTNQEITNRTGIHRQNVSGLFTGRIVNPTLGTITAVAEALDLTVTVCRPHHEVLHSLTADEQAALVAAARMWARDHSNPCDDLLGAIRKIIDRTEESG
jgi:transcriptional regulator with XRE-family HTH domain